MSLLPGSAVSKKAKSEAAEEPVPSLEDSFIQQKVAYFFVYKGSRKLG